MSGSWKVSLRLQLGGRWISVAGPRDALVVMEEAWPSLPGPMCASARKRCYESMQIGGVADTSRKPFIAAAIEAQIFFV